MVSSVLLVSFSSNHTGRAPQLTSSGANYATKLKFLLGIDDALDIFAEHAVGGFIGNVLTAFFAADSRASWTAPIRTSRLMPFSRSQNSKTAKKSAFITKYGVCLVCIRRTKKPEMVIIRLSRWPNQQTLPFYI